MIAALIDAVRKGSIRASEKVGNLPVLQRMILTFRQAGIERVVVLCTESEEKLAAHMDVLFARDFAGAMACLEGKCDRLFYTPVDRPLFLPETLHALKNESRTVFPAYQGESGFPCLLLEEDFNKLLEGRLEDLPHIAVEDPGILPHSLPELERLAQQRERPLRPDIRIRVCAEQPVLGPGTFRLLNLTQETGALREACRRMGISYSKGWKMLSQMEHQLGYPVLERRQGGKTGGSSAVTEEGQRLMMKYTAFLADANEYINSIFPKYFGNDEE